MKNLTDRRTVQTAPIFIGLSDEERDEVISGASTQRYEAGTNVFEQGEPASRFYVLVSGRLRVTQLNEEGQQTIVRIVNPGDFSA